MKSTLTYISLVVLIIIALVMAILLIFHVSKQTPEADTFQLPTNEKGIILKDINITSTDNGLVLVLANNTMLIDPEGRPVNKITLSLSWSHDLIIITERQIGGIPVSPLYNFSPAGVTIEPPAIVKLKYNKTLASLIGNEHGIQVVYFLNGSWKVIPYRYVDASKAEVMARLEVFPQSLCAIVLTVRPSQFE